MSSISNRDRHIRHYCEHAKVVFFEREIVSRIKIFREEIVEYLTSLDPDTKISDILDGQNIITNRGNV